MTTARIHRAADRFHTDAGWLDSRHTFSFGHHYDPTREGFRGLRVVNDDRVAPGGGFGTHGHRDMEIVSYVVEGALAHRDSLGTGSVIRPGDVQRMSAGTGIRHSELNPSDTEPVRFLQLWFLPNARGVTPGYEQRAVPAEERRGRLRLLVDPDGADDAVSIHADARLFGALLEPGEEVSHSPADGRHTFVQVVRGAVDVGGVSLAEGDGLATSDPAPLTLTATASAEVLLFDLA